jgi:hypothetical protein
MTDERPVRPLILPDTVELEPVQPMPMPTLPTRQTELRDDTTLLVGVAAVSHSGRVRDQALFDALGWAPGDHLQLELLDALVLIRRTPTGTHQLNGRGQVFLPSAVRTLLGIADNERVLLAAIPDADLLIVHSCGIAAAALRAFYQGLPGFPEDV